MTSKTKNKALRGAGYLIMIILSGVFFTSAITDAQNYFSLQHSIQENLALKEQKEEEKETLETTKRNLTNPDYAELMARGRYLVTKEGEQIFKFPSIDKR